MILNLVHVQNPAAFNISMNKPWPRCYLETELSAMVSRETKAATSAPHHEIKRPHASNNGEGTS
eukprot:2632263-Amphidinium_carterae.1